MPSDRPQGPLHFSSDTKQERNKTTNALYADSIVVTVSRQFPADPSRHHLAGTTAPGDFVADQPRLSFRPPLQTRPVIPNKKKDVHSCLVLGDFVAHQTNALFRLRKAYGGQGRARLLSRSGLQTASPSTSRRRTQKNHAVLAVAPAERWTEIFFQDGLAGGKDPVAESEPDFARGP